jgi:hypothetical protein
VAQPESLEDVQRRAEERRVGAGGGIRAGVGEQQAEVAVEVVRREGRRAAAERGERGRRDRVNRRAEEERGRVRVRVPRGGGVVAGNGRLELGRRGGEGLRGEEQTVWSAVRAEEEG